MPAETPKPDGREEAVNAETGEARPRSRSLLGWVLMVVGVSCLVLVSGALPAGGTAHPQGADLQPALFPGIFMSISCHGGKITFNGTVACDNTTVNSYGFGPATGGVIWYSLAATMKPSYGFTSFSTSGACLGTHTGTCKSSVTSNPTQVWASCPRGQHCAPGLTLSTVQGNTTFAVFENWSTNYSLGKIQVCLGNSCTTYSNGQATVLVPGDTYTLKGVNLPGNTQVSQWNSPAGSFSSNTTNPTNFTVSGIGPISMIVLNNTSMHWDGYLYAPATASSSITSVSGDIQLPAQPVPGTSESFEVALSIGGLPGTANWTVGVDWYVPPSNSSYGDAFWQECTAGGTCTRTYWSGSANILSHDTLAVTLTSSGGVSGFTLKVVGTSYSWSGSQTFTPYADDAAWYVSGAGFVDVVALPAFSELGVGGTAVPLTSSLAASGANFPAVIGGLHLDQFYHPSLLTVSGGYPTFSD